MKISKLEVIRGMINKMAALELVELENALVEMRLHREILELLPDETIREIIDEIRGALNDRAMKMR